MQDDDHLAVARLKQSVLDVVVQDVHFVSSDGREAEAWGQMDGAAKHQAAARGEARRCCIFSGGSERGQSRCQPLHGACLSSCAQSSVSTAPSVSPTYCIARSSTSVPQEITHTIDVGLQRTLHPLLGNVWANVQIFQFGITAVEVDHQGVLFHDALSRTRINVNPHASLLCPNPHGSRCRKVLCWCSSSPPSPSLLLPGSYSASALLL